MSQHEIATAWAALKARKAVEQAAAAVEQQTRKAQALDAHRATSRPFSRRERRGPGRH